MSFSYKTILTLNYQIEKYQMANPFSILIDILNLFSYIVFLRSQVSYCLLKASFILFHCVPCIVSFSSSFIFMINIYTSFFSGSKVIERNYIILMAGIEIRIFTFEPT